MPKPLDKTLRRYTSLSIALDVLINERLTLVNPSKWDDGNDAYFIELYKTKSNVGTVLASCLTMSTETYHHWKIFSNGLDGVCIEFDRQALESDVKKVGGIRFEPVRYKLIKELRAMTRKDVDLLPFIKRDAYGDEREWRMIATDQAENVQWYSLKVRRSSIQRIRLSPWTHADLRKTIRNLIRAQPGCERVSVVSSGLTNSQKWKDAGAAIAS